MFARCSGAFIELAPQLTDELDAAATAGAAQAEVEPAPDRAGAATPLTP